MTSTPETPVRLRALQPADAGSFAAAFAAMGWSKPASQFEEYLVEQEAGLRSVIVGLLANEVAGYVTIRWPKAASQHVAEIADLNVLEAFRRRGVGTRLMDAAEAEVAVRYTSVRLAVGLHRGYGPAQRMYALRGYVPDRRGATHRERLVREGELAPVDDDLVLHLMKSLPQGRDSRS